MNISKAHTADATTEAMQIALVDAIKNYAQAYEDGMRIAPFQAGHEVTQTDVAIAASMMLKSVDMELFELAMWEVWNCD